MTRARRSWFLHLVVFALIQVLLCAPILEPLAYAAQTRSRATQASRASVPDDATHGTAGRAGSAPSGSAARTRPALQSATEVVPAPLFPAFVSIDPSADKQPNDPWSLFDGTERTGLVSTTGAKVRVRVQLAAIQRFDELAVFGPAQGKLTVLAERSGMLEKIDGLAGLDLQTVGARWSRFRASVPIRTSALVLEWQPLGEQGPKEIVLWGLGAPSRTAAEPELADRVLAGQLTGAHEVASQRASAEVARLSGSAHFPIRLAADPRAFARAFLVYELRGLGHWTSALRRINGGPANTVVSRAGSDGGLQVEEISPDWLHAGDNSVDFLPVSAFDSPGYRVERLRIVGVPHATSLEPQAMTTAVEAGSKWAPGERFAVASETPFQYQTLAVELDRASKAELFFARGGSNKQQLRINLHGVAPGWHYFELDRTFTPTVNLGLAIRSQKRADPGIRNLFISGSAIPAADAGRIVVTYPLHGECKGETARILGFVEGRATNELRANGRPLPVRSDGSFDLELPVPEAAKTERWSLGLEVPSVSGSALSNSVSLGPCAEKSAQNISDPSAVRIDEGAPFSQLVQPDRDSVVSFAGARLDIPAGALEQPTRISIRPLVFDQVQPMNRAMHNVTPERRAFRLGPHGLKFKKPIKLTLPYEQTALPPALGPRDIHSFYYDDGTRQWLKIGRFDQTQRGVLVAITDHFTDFVNATLAMPDAPGAKSFNPTELKGIELGSPSAGVSLINPPEASSSGSARLSHPLEVPPGRNGIQPSLSIAYDSNTRNGWLGVGWDVGLSSIEVDTRFGVPTYQGAERYLLDGEQLIPCTSALGKPCQAGVSNQFVRRVERAFDRIERLGSSAADYSWRVTTKSGVKYSYGQTAQARLADPNVNPGPISRWFLERVEDPFGNAMQIEYWTDRGVNTQEPFVQVYPRHVHYTSHPERAATYHVDFNLEGDNPATAVPDPLARTDVLITGRSGFQVLTRYRLGSVSVRLDNEVIRSYGLTYDAHSDFAKSMLTSLSLGRPATGTEPAKTLYQHTFEYYKAPRDDGGRIAAFSPRTKWGTSHRRSDGFSRGDHNTKGGSAGGGVGIGPISITASGGGFSGTERIRLATLDLNGDGLPDLLDHDNHASFNVLRGVPAQEHFERRDVFGLTKDGLGHTDRSGWMVEGSLQITAFSGGVSYTRSTTEDDRTLSDINGDGFPDLVSVKNNLIQARINDGRGRFREIEDWGSVPLDVAPSGLPEFGGDPSVRAAFHLVDPLVRWTAPFAGQIAIAGAIRKLESGGDGVVAEIFHNNQRLWRRALGADEVQACAAGSNDGCDGSGITVAVQAGDRIYTKLNADNTPSLDADHDGFADDPLRVSTAFDAVEWQPSIRYSVASELQNLREPHGAFIYQFSQAVDHSLAGKPLMPWTPSSKGKIRITGNVEKAPSADETLIEIIKETPRPPPFPALFESVLSRRLSAGSGSIDIDHMGPNNLGLELDVLPNETLYFRVHSDSPIDPHTVTWNPQITYLTYCRVDPATEAPVCGPVQCSGTPPEEVTCLIQNDPTPDTPLPGSVIHQHPEVYVPLYQTLPLTPTISYPAPAGGQTSFECSLFKPTTAAPVRVLVQGVNKLIGKLEFPASQQVAFQTFNCGTATMTAGEQLFFTVLSEEPAPGVILSVKSGATVVPLDRVNYRHRDKSFDAALPFPLDSLPQDAFSGGYHRWFTGYYNGSVGFHESRLGFPGVPNSRFAIAVPARVGLPQVPVPLWLTGSADSYIGPGLQRPSRVGSASSGAGVDGVPLVSGLRKSETYNVDLKFGALIAGVQAGKGATSSQLDFIDMNGDGYPDSVANDGVSFNTGNLAFAPKSRAMAMPDESMRRIEQRTASASIAAGASLINQTNSRGKSESLLATSVNVGVNYGVSGTSKDLVDVNGDGLPDHVSASGSNLSVRLNLGTRFSKPINWQSPGWEKTSVNTDGIIQDIAEPLMNTLFGAVSTNSVRLHDTSGRTVGVGADSEVFGVGGSVGKTYTVARRVVELIDLNGDGLPDRVMKDPEEGFLRVKLNLGSGFGSEQRWPVPSWGSLPINPGGLTFLGGADTLGFERTTSYDGSFSVKVCFIACVKATGFYSKGSGWSQMEFEDIDGDGRLDHVVKLDGQDEVHAKLNRLNEEGLLWKVHRPLGASFEIKYKREGNEVRFASDSDRRPVIDMPSNQWVLAQVITHDSPSNSTYQRSFDYRETAAVGTGFYDRVEREEYGYGFVRTVGDRPSAKPNDQVVFDTRLHNKDLFRRGLPFETLGYTVDGRLIERQQITYREPTDTTAFSTRFFAPEIERKTSWYEGTRNLDAPGMSTREERDWDEFGNLETLEDHGDSGADDNLVYAVHYFHDAAAHIFSADSVEARDLAGNLYRKRTAVFEAGTGKLLSLTNVLSGGKNPETLAAYNQARATSTYVQDQFGNFTQATDPLGSTTTYAYDDRTETHQTSVVDVFGYRSTSVPDYRFGQPAELTDRNGHEVRYEFDEWGRPSKVFGPYDQGVNDRPTLAVSYGLMPGQEPRPAWARTAHEDVTHPEDPEIVTVSFADGLERTLQTKKDLERDTGTATTVGMSVSGAFELDELGRVKTEGQPIFSTAPETQFVVHQPKNATLTEYDEQSRPVVIQTPDSNAPGGYARTVTTHGFGESDGKASFLTRLDDALANRRLIHRDVDGSVLAVEQFNEFDGQETQLVTRYRYNPVNELLRVTDAKGNPTDAQYDTFGRMVSLVNRDSGRSEWSYDLAGNLGAKQSARLAALGQRIRYQYTHNRLDRIDNPTSADVEFVYGPPAQAGDSFGNVAGRITEERSEAGVKKLKYDRLGNVTERSMSFVRIREANRPPYSATIRYQFDSLGRMLKMHFPGEGAEEVTYAYDRGGLITTVFGVNTQAVKPPRAPPLTNYMLFVGYDEFEQRTRVIYGNGVETKYEYDAATRRLSQINSDHRDPVLVRRNRPPRPFQRLRYQYDVVGNILNLRNDAPFDDSMNGVFVAKTTQSFGYDKLYQLRTAEGIYQDESKSRERYSLGFKYDEIGNIGLKDQASFRDLPNPDGTWEADQPFAEQTYRAVYEYAGPRPHAPTRIDEHLVNSQVYTRELSYDASGNQSGWVYHHSQNRETDWTDDNLIHEIRERGQRLTRVHYDGGGNKSVHVDYYGNEETAYLDQHYTLRNADYPSKHIVVDNQLVASKLDPSWFPHPPTVYFHGDHLGSAQYATNDLQELVQHDEFFPTGELWEDQTEPNYTVRRAYRFTGKEYDAGAKLYYYGARWYDARQSQWVSPDPILGGSPFEPVHLALYTYAANNPVRLGDPTGLAEDIPVNFAPKGANPGARFFFDRSKKGGLVNFGNAQSFDAAAAGHQVFRYNPDKGFDRQTASMLSDLHSTLRGGESSGLLDDVTAGAGFLNMAKPDAVRTDGSGSSGGIPGGKCTSCPGSKAAQGIYIATAALPLAVGAAVLAKGAMSAAPRAYSVAFEATLTPRGVGTYPAHFAEANSQLLAAMGNPELAAALRQSLGKNFEGSIVSASGGIRGVSPAGWTWHHVPGRSGVLQLVPGAQHAPGSAWQGLLHPGGAGGMAEWGQLY